MSTFSRELSSAEVTVLMAGTPSPAMAINNAGRVGLLVLYGNGCSAGEFSLTSAHDPNFAGTWSEQTSVPVPSVVPGAEGAAATAGVEIVGAFVRVERKTAVVGGVITRVVIYAA